MFVTVIIPNYNHEKYLISRLESVLKQTYDNYEIIILDDKSTDNSINVLEKYKNHPKVTHFIKNEINSGSTFEQWNKGINLAKGDYIWIAESDDISDEFFLEKVINAFKKDKNIGLCYSQSNRMDSTNKITGDWLDWTNPIDKKNVFVNDFTMNGMDFVREFLIQKNVIPNASAVVFKRSIYKEVGGANRSLKTNGDWDIWLKMCSITTVSFLSEKLNYFRYHEGSVIAKEVRNQNNFINIYMLQLRQSYQIFLMANELAHKDIVEKINQKKISYVILKFAAYTHKHKGDFQYAKVLMKSRGWYYYFFGLFLIYLRII